MTSLMSYPVVARLTGAICLLLCLAILSAPSLFFWLFGLEPSLSGEVMARRAGMLFLLPAVLLFALRDPASAPLRKAVAQGLSVTLLGLAFLGITEAALGRVGAGIAVAVLVELALFVLWLRLSRET